MKALLYIHGKGGNADEAAYYKSLLPNYHVVGLDYHATTPWETKDELLSYYHSLARKYASISMIANSIGAYFAMNALGAEKIEQAFFISPIVDMEGLISRMMSAAQITPEELEKKQEIPTAFGETLSWKYLSYVKSHPLIWRAPTHILYGEKDTLIPLETIAAFAHRIRASLTIMKNGEHWFHTDEQMVFLEHWLKQYV
ncbi:alpha/beta hydrolase [Candidatus Avelusimicrobium luingense]|uniref:alpha/beta hydrolase n=1 Tax=Candidatus Avelusimicrobium luingense TaxID=3416211 RepID=UPI003D0A2B05